MAALPGIGGCGAAETAAHPGIVASRGLAARGDGGATAMP